MHFSIIQTMYNASLMYRVFCEMSSGVGDRHKAKTLITGYFSLSGKSLLSSLGPSQSGICVWLFI